MKFLGTISLVILAWHTEGLETKVLTMSKKQMKKNSCMINTVLIFLRLKYFDRF